jgi:hypothetical protein
VLTDDFRQRAIANLSIEHGLELDVAPRYGVADDDEIEFGADVVGPIATERANPRPPENRSWADTRPDPNL